MILGNTTQLLSSNMVSSFKSSSCSKTRQTNTDLYSLFVAFQPIKYNKLSSVLIVMTETLYSDWQIFYSIRAVWGRWLELTICRHSMPVSLFTNELSDDNYLKYYFFWPNTTGLHTTHHWILEVIWAGWLSSWPSIVCHY